MRSNGPCFQLRPAIAAEQTAEESSGGNAVFYHHYFSCVVSCCCSRVFKDVRTHQQQLKSIPLITPKSSCAGILTAKQGTEHAKGTTHHPKHEQQMLLMLAQVEHAAQARQALIVPSPLLGRAAPASGGRFHAQFKPVARRKHPLRSCASISQRSFHSDEAHPVQRTTTS